MKYSGILIQRTINTIESECSRFAGPKETVTDIGIPVQGRNPICFQELENITIIIIIIIIIINVAIPAEM
jgi:hypothetical protein